MGAPSWLRRLLTILVKLGKAGGYIDPDASKKPDIQVK